MAVLYSCDNANHPNITPLRTKLYTSLASFTFPVWQIKYNFSAFCVGDVLVFISNLECLSMNFSTCVNIKINTINDTIQLHLNFKVINENWHLQVIAFFLMISMGLFSFFFVLTQAGVIYNFRVKFYPLISSVACNQFCSTWN